MYLLILRPVKWFTISVAFRRLVAYCHWDCSLMIPLSADKPFWCFTVTNGLRTSKIFGEHSFYSLMKSIYHVHTEYDGALVILHEKKYITHRQAFCKWKCHVASWSKSSARILLRRVNNNGLYWCVRLIVQVNIYRQTYNIKRTNSLNSNVSRSFRVSVAFAELKPGVKSRMKTKLKHAPTTSKSYWSDIYLIFYSF